MGLRLRSNLRQSAAGFTLLELFAVVLIISIIAVLAIPAVGKQMRDRRTRLLAEQIADHYRSARMRALGRGGAVMIRIVAGTPATQPSIQVREAVRGGAANAAASFMPVSTCNLTNWNLADLVTAGGLTASRTLTQINVAQNASFEGLAIDTRLPNGGALQSVNSLAICFTPMGRALVSTNGAVNWNPLASVPVAQVYRDAGGGKSIGLQRVVALLPNGAARLDVAGARP